MTAEQFVYWLQGFIELSGDDIRFLRESQWLIVKDHLNLVFDKQTPTRVIVDPVTINTVDSVTPYSITPFSPNGLIPKITC